MSLAYVGFKHQREPRGESLATQARNAYAAVFPGGNPTRGQGSAAAKATAPPTLAKGLALSRRSRPEQTPAVEPEFTTSAYTSI